MQKNLTYFFFILHQNSKSSLYLLDKTMVLSLLHPQCAKKKLIIIKCNHLISSKRPGTALPVWPLNKPQLHRWKRKNKLFVLLCKCLKTVSCIRIVQSLCKFMICIQMLIKTLLVCEVSLLNRTKRAEQRHPWEGQWQERNYAAASLGHHLLMCSSMPGCR